MRRHHGIGDTRAAGVQVLRLSIGRGHREKVKARLGGKGSKVDAQGAERRGDNDPAVGGVRVCGAPV